MRGSLIKKLVTFNDIIQNTYNHITESKRNRALTVNDFKQCSNDLKGIRSVISAIYEEVLNKTDDIYDDIVGKIQKINVDMSNVIKKWEQRTLMILYMCFGKEYKNTIIKNANSGLSSILENNSSHAIYNVFIRWFR